MKYKCCNCGSTVEVKHEEIFRLRHGLCDSCYDFAMKIEDVINRIDEIRKNVDDVDYDILTSAKEQIEAIGRKYQEEEN